MTRRTRAVPHTPFALLLAQVRRTGRTDALADAVELTIDGETRALGAWDTPTLDERRLALYRAAADATTDAAALDDYVRARLRQESDR